MKTKKKETRFSTPTISINLMCVNSIMLILRRKLRLGGSCYWINDINFRQKKIWRKFKNK